MQDPYTICGGLQDNGFAQKPQTGTFWRNFQTGDGTTCVMDLGDPAWDVLWAAAQEHGKVAGFLCTDVAGGRALREQGFRVLAYGGDLWLYQQALREGIAGLKRAD